MNNLYLIKQYVNTGQQIGEYQFSKLNDNLKNSYLRKRIQTIGLDINDFTNDLRGYEFIKLSNESHLDIIDKLNGVGFGVLLDDKHKLDVLNILFQHKQFYKKLKDNNTIYNVMNAFKHIDKDKEKYFLEKLFSNELIFDDIKEVWFGQILKSGYDPNIILSSLEKNIPSKSKTKIFYLIRNLPESMISYLFKLSSNQKELFNLLGTEKSKHFFNQITARDFIDLIRLSKNPEPIFYLAKISNSKALEFFIKDADENKIAVLLSNATNKTGVINLLKNNGMSDKIPDYLTKSYDF